MSLAAGTRLGPYEILSPLGAGGMGEVYRARDPRLGREVAVKVLPEELAGDAERLVRFEREARAASALSDPHIVTVYDVGRDGDRHYFVSELVEGSDLRHRLDAGALPARRALELAEQIAAGLAAAHEKGIVHRDLKPENILITKSGAAKIADFGLAKITGPLEGGVAQLPTSDGHSTAAGVVMGTFTYMSPEQARGSAVDFRSDQFSFGSILYEMLAGAPAFRRDSAPETLSAIIREDPQALARVVPTVPPSAAWIVERCLAKDPTERYDSTRDLARDLAGIRQHLSDSRVAMPSPAATPWRRRAPLLALAGAVALLVAAGVALWRRPPFPTWPSFQRLTFRRGTVTGARFAADGEAVVYSAQWEGQPGELFTVRPGDSESRPLGVRDALLLAVSSTDELVVELRPRLWSGVFRGTLARLPLGGGSPRELLEDVQAADWSPDGTGLAVVRHDSAGFRWRVEFPTGKLLSEESTTVRGLRISPDGRRIAFSEGFAFRAESSFGLIDLAGERKVLGGEPVTGLAWSPAGDEIWISSPEPGGATKVEAVTPAGRKRLVYRAAGTMVPWDISRQGSLLAGAARQESSVFCLPPGGSRERDLAWHAGSSIADIAADGSMVLLDERERSDGVGSTFYVRRTDGSPAVRLGDGIANAFSPDGKWVVAKPRASENRVALVPIGAGEPKGIPTPLPPDQFWLFPDGRRILVSGHLPNGQTRLFSVDLDGNDFRQIAPDGFDTFVGEMPISPDGRLVAASKGAASGSLQIFPVDGGEARPVRGFEAGDVVIRWAADGRSLFVFKRDELPARIVRLDLETGRRSAWRDLVPADPAGILRIPVIAMTPDGRSYAYGFSRELSDLYLIRGLN